MADGYGYYFKNFSTRILQLGVTENCFLKVLSNAYSKISRQEDLMAFQKS